MSDQEEYEKNVAAWKRSLGEEAYVGVDLDATLAHYDGWHGPLHIGAPIPRMVRRVKALVARGVRVKVFTARASESDPVMRARIVKAIQDWTEEHVGFRLEVTNVKDYELVALFDDRAVQVVPNTGVRVDGVEDDGA